jgi:diguanylate cyclase (GGDEF)-like protein
VDNDRDRAAEMVIKLEGEGLVAESSEGGSGSALWLAQTWRPWVILANHALPVTDGLEVCRLLKGDSETSHVPLLLTIPDEKDDDVISALEAGANAVITGSAGNSVLMAHIYAQLNTFQTVMELREKNQYLRELVVRDPMTGLFNHAHLHEILDKEIATSRRTESPVSVMMIDIDEVKAVNDEHGHQAGDYCLKATADLISQGGRRADAAARYGGDIFAIVLPNTAKKGAAVRGETLRRRIEGRVFAEMGLPSMTVSVGVSGFPDDGDNRAAVLQAADRALYAAKHVGRNKVVSYHEDLQIPGAGSDLPIERLLALSETIRDLSVRFVYQPIVHGENAQPYAYEALCRPQHDAFPHPGVLFDTAERAGRVKELGRACRQVSTEPLFDLHPDKSLFLNLHPLELNAELVDEALENLADVAKRVVFEITESAEISDYKHQRSLIERLQEAGFRVAVDDLGAGYAGLNSLALLKPDFVKLDMALVRGIESNNSVARLIQHIIDFTSGEGMLVVAEGVETAKERDVVAELGCPLMQGYFFAKPGPPFPEVQPEAL